jgi:glycine/D-amino acid oxidase-like deaminating enzyme
MQHHFLGWEGSEGVVERVWVRIMRYTPDGWPHVGRVPGERGMWMLAGFHGEAWR